MSTKVELTSRCRCQRTRKKTVEFLISIRTRSHTRKEQFCFVLTFCDYIGRAINNSGIIGIKSKNHKAGKLHNAKALSGNNARHLADISENHQSAELKFSIQVLRSHWSQCQSHSYIARARFNFKVACDVCKVFLAYFVVLFSIPKCILNINERETAPSVSQYLRKK